MRLQDLFEDPISDLDHLGDFTKPGPFRNQLDKKLATHPVSLEKIRNFFKNTDWDIRLYFCNISGTGKHAESGLASDLELEIIFGKAIADQLMAEDDQITMVFLGNSGAERMPFTPWVIAHRMGHAIQASTRSASRSNAAFYWQEAEQVFFRGVNEVLRDVYRKRIAGNMREMKIDLSLEYSALFNAIGTQKSSRDHKINRPFEFVYESFAQYLHTGNITYNPLPRRLGFGKQAWGKPTRYLNAGSSVSDEELADASWRIANNLEANFYKITNE
jgi:hypothetical protein